MNIKVDAQTLAQIVYWPEQKPPLYDSAHEELLHAWAKLLRPLVSVDTPQGGDVTSSIGGPSGD
jgi:hypothetical protein